MQVPKQNPYAAPQASSPAHETFCIECYAAISKKAAICPKCGVRQRKSADKTALLMLTFFLGAFGAHRFYLGHYLRGAIYLLLCWTGAPAIIALLEFIAFAFMSADKLEETYEAHGKAVLFVIVPLVFIIAGSFLMLLLMLPRADSLGF